MPQPGRLARFPRWVAAILIAVCVSFVVTSDVHAQGTGGVQGVVRNAETGEPLDYANVVLEKIPEGTQWGGMSLGGGRFFLRGIPAGDYVLRILYLGFKPVEEEITVPAGETVNVEYDLEVTIAKTFDAFVVESRAIMVEVKDTETVYTIGSEDLTDYAVDTVEEAVARQAGVVSRGGELHVRGGRSGEISFRVDGVAVDDPLGGSAISVSTFSVGKIETVTGGQDPEFGNALSGVVNIQTREGKPDDFEFNARFTTDDFGRQDRTFTNYDRFEFGFGGPTGLAENLTYWISGDMVFTDNENFNRAFRPETKVELFGMELFKYRRRQQNDVKGSVKLAYTFDEGKKKATAEYIGNYTRSEPYRLNWDTQGYVRQLVRLPLLIDLGDRLIYDGGYGTFFYGPWVENINNLAVTRPVTTGTGSGARTQPLPILRLRDIRGTERVAIAQPVFVGARSPDGLFSTVPEDSSYQFVNSADLGQQNQRYSEQMKLFWRQTLTDDTFYELKLSRVSFDLLQDVRQDASQFEYLHGGMRGPDIFNGETQQYIGQRDYYSDPDNPVFVTTGSDFPFYNDQRTTQYTLNFDITSQRYAGHKLKAGLRVVYNDLSRRSINSPGVISINRLSGEAQQGTSRNIFQTFNPEASFYLQDRWEYEGMVLSGGFRWDMFSPGSEAQIEVDNEELDRNVFKYKHQISPRLGFAFPITDKDAFNFHYGRFVQFPGRDVLFASQDVVGNSSTLGNPNLDSELTIQYQAGIKHQFNDFLAAQFAVYNKDIFGLISATQVVDEATGSILDRYINRAYGNARGLELTLERRFHNRWAFELAYTYAFADGVASSQEFGSNPNELEFLPNQELPLNWDQRHSVAMNLRIAEPNKWAAAITFDYGSGFPWTPFFRFERRQDPLLENSERLPATYSLRIQAERNVNFYGQNLTLYLQGLNLLNEDAVASLQPGLFPGVGVNNASEAGVAYLTETGKYGNAYLQDVDGDNIDDFVPLNDPRVFSQHRLFRVGIGWRF